MRWREWWLVAAALLAYSDAESGTDDAASIQGATKDVDDGTTPFIDPEQVEHDDVAHPPLSSKKLLDMHGKIDSNGDGKMSMVEILDFSRQMRHQAARSISISAMDTNKDGKLSLEELLAHVEVEETARHASHTSPEEAAGEAPRPAVQESAEEGGESDAHTDPPELSEQEESDRATELDQRRQHEVRNFKNADRNKDELLDSEELPHFFYPEMHDDALARTANDTILAKDMDGDGELSIEEFWQRHSGHSEGETVEASAEEAGDHEQEEEKAMEEAAVTSDGSEDVEANDGSEEASVTSDGSEDVEAHDGGEDHESASDEHEEHEFADAQHEEAESHSESGEDEQETISDEEHEDFAKLDLDHSGTLSLEEVKAWESGHFYDHVALRRLFELADKDNDDHVSADEFNLAREHILGSDALHLLKEWSELHHEL